jgi:hypothetical protein
MHKPQTITNCTYEITGNTKRNQRKTYPEKMVTMNLSQLVPVMSEVKLRYGCLLRFKFSRFLSSKSRYFLHFDMRFKGFLFRFIQGFSRVLDTYIYCLCISEDCLPLQVQLLQISP